MTTRTGGSRTARHRVVQAQAGRTLVRYVQYLAARSHTDHARIWIDGPQLTVLLLDTNLMPEDRAAELVPAVIDEMDRWQASGMDLLGLFRAGRSYVTSVLEHSAVPVRERFVNAGLLRITGMDVGFIGAYAPLYLCEPGAMERIVFDGTVWGISGVEAYPETVGRLSLRDDQRVFVLSDGMLESRTPAGKINGDSLLSRYWREADGVPTEDAVEELCARYRAADSEGLDSHGLLAIEPVGRR